MMPLIIFHGCLAAVFFFCNLETAGLGLDLKAIVWLT